MNATIRDHLLAGYTTRIILYKTKMRQDFEMRELNMDPNGRVNNVSKPIESERMIIIS